MLGRISAEMRHLSTIIGAGRHRAGVTVTLMQAEGAGVYLPLHYVEHRSTVALGNTEKKLTGEECGFWLSQPCWDSWLASSLATADCQLLAAELVTAVAHWAISPLLPLLPELVIDEPAPQPMTLLNQWAVVLTFELEGQQLRGALLGWPLAALAETVAHWESEQANQQELLWQASLVVGWSRLSLHQLQQITPGDGLRISRAAELEQGNCWLWQMAAPQMYIKLEDGNKMTIQQVNDDIDQLLELDIALVEKNPQKVMLDNLPQTLVMEIGRLSLPMGELTQLAVGQTLACQTHLYGEVNIRLHGQSVGSGSLLSCEGELLVRIDQWLTPRP
ncbi:YscQ/HrcQ family type III secretion apparatus protein [Yersinia rohdei]|uniref:YscQ/HrcQ family type III secretion apparatus protein n=1 Tax=Yersinia rohdei TaxID=29485 RepID=UPI0005E34170|nr:YscQ/HrcQ family type III secretion apparatus protein [Yersinia rohdei]CQJ48332.1 type III secretion inner membrane protein [Yersinia rohdei]